jgi:hypothetical protein
MNIEKLRLTYKEMIALCPENPHMDCSLRHVEQEDIAEAQRDKALRWFVNWLEHYNEPELAGILICEARVAKLLPPTWDNTPKPRGEEK